MARASFARTLLWICSGIIVWALHFAVVYGMTTLTCALGLGEIRLPWFSLDIGILLATAIALGAALAVTAWAMLARSASFENRLTAGVGAIAALAIVWEGLVPVFMLPACL